MEYVYMHYFRAGLALLFISFLLGAQTAAGEIRLQVSDPSGVAMKATGTLQSVAPGIPPRFTSDDRGTYTFATLPFGRYRLEISKSGFATQPLFVEVESQSP